MTVEYSVGSAGDGVAIVVCHQSGREASAPFYVSATSTQTQEFRHSFSVLYADCGAVMAPSVWPPPTPPPPLSRALLRSGAIDRTARTVLAFPKRLGASIPSGRYGRVFFFSFRLFREPPSPSKPNGILSILDVISRPDLKMAVPIMRDSSSILV